VLITLVPAHRLPAVLRRGLAHLAPAALAALVVTALVGHAAWWPGHADAARTDTPETAPERGTTEAWARR